ncbi:MAG: broad specificity phosphatase PhoE [Paraglaciecola sp.]|jgi:broad specificity phosphatase PhoE
MSELYLVRHGQASFGAKNYDKLSELGMQQAKWLGEYFQQREIDFSRIWLGDLVRHQETAEGICSAFSQPPERITRGSLNEFDFQNIAAAYLNLFPHEKPAPDAQPAAFYRLLKKAMKAWSDGRLPLELLTESWQQFRQRVEQSRQDICAADDGNPVLVVSSGGAIAMFMSIVLGLGAEQVIELNMQIKNSAFSHFYFNQRTVRLSSFNNIPHMDVPERFSKITFS